MKTVGAFDAKTHFSQILLEVTQGESFTVTKRGHKVALITPLCDTDDNAELIARSIDDIRKLRKGTTLGKGLSIKSIKQRGRA